MESTQAFMQKSETNFSTQATAIKNLEVQVGQLAEMLNERPPQNMAEKFREKS